MGVPASFLPSSAPRRGGAWGSQPALAGTAKPRDCLPHPTSTSGVPGLWDFGAPHLGDLNVPQSRSCNQDQFEVLERHTQWGLDLLDKYVKFVKERAEVEQAYAKQLR